MCPNQLKSDFRDYSRRRSLLLEENISSLKEALLCAQTQKIGTMLADYTKFGITQEWVCNNPTQFFSKSAQWWYCPLCCAIHCSSLGSGAHIEGVMGPKQI